MAESWMDTVELERIPEEPSGARLAAALEARRRAKAKALCRASAEHTWDTILAGLATPMRWMPVRED